MGTLRLCENGNVVDVHGSTKRRRELAAEIVHYCIRELMPRIRTLDIDVELNKCMDDGAFGSCYALITNREFHIEVDKRLYDAMLQDFIETICHEMVHVWQQARNMMIDRVYPKRLGYRQLWMNQKTGKYQDHTDTVYSKQPWELQAYRMQGKLVGGFRKEYFGK
jgi:hypothetical protein